MPFIPPDRAHFASDPTRSRGRDHSQTPSYNRTEFQRDRDRIIHASAFRRLKQKTQVFVAHEGDYYRTRLTHSLEVAQIARSVARALGLDEDLAETLALAHDIGHPPFGHAGEEILADCMEAYEGFDHNAQSLRVVTALETRYPQFLGLNLTWETREGLVKHNGPLLGALTEKPKQGLEALPAAFRLYPHLETLELHTYAGPEAQIAALADDIAYNNHDLDDGLAAGLFAERDLSDIPLVGETFAQVRKDYPEIADDRVRAEAIRRLIGVWVCDLIEETQNRIDQFRPDSVEAVRTLEQPLAGFSPEHAKKHETLRMFFKKRMYRHQRINQMRSQAKRIICDLFELFVSEPEILPQDWQNKIENSEDKKHRIVCDYIAGMTDVFAISEYRRLFLLEGWK